MRRSAAKGSGAPMVPLAAARLGTARAPLFRDPGVVYLARHATVVVRT